MMTADLTAHPMTLTLGALTLTVTGYQLDMAVPVRKHTLCDGSQHLALLPESPCTLTVSGTVLRGDAAWVISALEAALHDHTAFSFLFAGTAFTDMQITELHSEVRNDAEAAGFRFTMTGGTAA